MSSGVREKIGDNTILYWQYYEFVSVKDLIGVIRFENHGRRRLIKDDKDRKRKDEGDVEGIGFNLC